MRKCYLSTTLFGAPFSMGANLKDLAASIPFSLYRVSMSYSVLENLWNEEMECCAVLVGMNETDKGIWLLTEVKCGS